MARKNKTQKINSYQKELEELQRKIKEARESLYKDLGKHLTETWNCEDEAKLKRLIDHFKSDAVILLNEDSEGNNGEEERDA
ncbi:hypothetical protein [Bacillus safensis]|uniref:hypothetical protein n=1 Tax=Bacillus safensis TaxID=561879 RepID=UPI00366AB930